MCWRGQAEERPPATATEVYDSLAMTVRPHINVPVYLVAQWLLINWWRLRWESEPSQPRRGWARVHSLAAIGGESLELGDFEFERGETMFILARAIGPHLYAHVIGGKRLGLPNPSPAAAETSTPGAAAGAPPSN